MTDGYSALAPVYDRLNRDIDYAAWADFLTETIRREHRLPHSPTLLLELGCGTGTMTIEMAERGFDITALDLSEEMLSIAEAKSRNAGYDILYLHEDMTDFELYGTVDAVICCLDGINHLDNRESLEDCLAMVERYLHPGGIFLFDVNTPYKFRTQYADNDYLLENDGAVCCWSNRLTKKGDACDFYLTVFEKQKNGLYKRTDGVQRERCYGRKALENAVRRYGMETIGVWENYTYQSPSQTAERWYFACRRLGYSTANGNENG